MLISQTSRLNAANTIWGFLPVEVDPSDQPALQAVFRCDWSPFVYSGNTRAGEHFRSAQCLFTDIDNTDGSTCTIEEFGKIFSGIRYVLSTSRNHQKEKKYGPGKNLSSPPSDRFHVIFPLDELITDPALVSAYLRGLIAKYPFFDRAVSGPAQLVFGNPATIIHISDGKQIKLVEETRQKKPAKEVRDDYETRDMSEADLLSTPANRVKLMAALRNSAAQGLFEEYSEWVKVGMALKAAGFSAQDFASISDPEAIDVALGKWESFASSTLTAGTLLYYAKQSTHLNLESDEDRELYEAGAAIFAEWTKNAQEERTKLLASRVKDATAGPPPDTMMPPSGLIRDIADYILRTSIRPIPVLAIAAATAFVGVLAGRKFESPTGLGTNLYFVGLAESGSGKEHARKVIKNMAYQAGCSRLMGGESIASGPGLRASLEVEPARMFMLDEFGLTLQGLNSKGAGSYQKDIITTFMKLYSAYGTIDHGPEYADQKMRKRVDIESPCCVLYATSTHGEFYAALKGGDGASGNIARMLIINAGDKRPDRGNQRKEPIPAELLERIRSLAEYKTPGSGNLATFFPTTVFVKPEVEQAFIDLDESMSKKMTSPEACSVYARVAENAIKLAMTYAVSMSFDTPIINEAAFVWGRDIATWCANTLMEQFNSYVADTDHGKTIKKMLMVIKATKAEGISGRELLQKIQEVRSAERDEILKKLLDSGQVFERTGEGKTPSRFIHADFYKE
ncbi:MAG TPA: PriCT-2 domain-containing protein [Dissulfurispiraceae bacterium]|nr:PriCT-2 domain-containing protein [Dissulfurispiraceae bacterium]